MLLPPFIGGGPNYFWLMVTEVRSIMWEGIVEGLLSGSRSMWQLLMAWYCPCSRKFRRKLGSKSQCLSSRDPCPPAWFHFLKGLQSPKT